MRTILLAAALLTATGGTAFAQQDDPRAALKRYCIGCHNSRLNTAGLDLDALQGADVPVNAATWEKVIRKLRGGTMPPQGSARPDAATYDALATWLETRIDEAARSRPRPGRVPAIHRLNRAEYSNAVRDLLAVEIDAAAFLPPDDSGFGFDNIADVLSVSPMLTERYLSAALKISRLAVGDPTIRPATDTFEVNKYLKQDDRVSDDLPFGSRGGAAIRYYFPVDGSYVVKIFFDRTYDGRVRGLSEPHALEVRLDGAKVQEITVGGAGGSGRGGRNVSIDGTEVRFSATAGPKTVAVSFVKKASRAEGMRRPFYAVTSYEYAGDVTLPPAIGSVELRGPYDVTGPGESPSRQRIFTCQDENERCARQILSTIARRAFRRPVTDRDIDPLMNFYRAARSPERRSAKAGVGAHRRHRGGPAAHPRQPGFSVPCSSRILPASRPGQAYRISDLELASRLSFFLWSSIPDDELLDAAARGELDAAAGPRASGPAHAGRSAVQGACRRTSRGSGCGCATSGCISPTRACFRSSTRTSGRRSSARFSCSSTARSVTTAAIRRTSHGRLHVRQRAAGAALRHPERLWQPFPPDHRFGRRAEGAVGQGWALDGHVVPAIARRRSFAASGCSRTCSAPRRRRRRPTCRRCRRTAAIARRGRSASGWSSTDRTRPARACHKVMDPLGFALENFDGIGRWRTDDAGRPIDPSGVLADGAAVDGPRSLRPGAAGQARGVRVHRGEQAADVCNGARR